LQHSKEKAVEENIDNNIKGQSIISQHKKGRRVNTGVTKKKTESIAEKQNKEPKLATRGSGNFKGRTGATTKKGVENLKNIVDADHIESFISTHCQHHNKEGKSLMVGNGDLAQNVEEVGEVGDGGPRRCYLVGPKGVSHPNIPRPPNEKLTFSSEINSTQHTEGDGDKDNEVFMDANDQSANGSIESDMEIVAETPCLEQ
jgi:hypothetical protein